MLFAVDNIRKRYINPNISDKKSREYQCRIENKDVVECKQFVGSQFRTAIIERFSVHRGIERKIRVAKSEWKRTVVRNSCTFIVGRRVECSRLRCFCFGFGSTFKRPHFKFDLFLAIGAFLIKYKKQLVVCFKTFQNIRFESFYWRRHCTSDRNGGRDLEGRSSRIRRNREGTIVLSLLLPRVINAKFPLQPQQKQHHTVWRTWFLIVYSDERW